jgi:SAM-dependent methyltransferase
MESTKRFTGRADYYSSYRPGYPDQVVTHLEAEEVLRPGSLVADIGAGTGISSALFLRHGYRVIAVEPNRDMRAAAIDQLSGYASFRGVDGTAEATTLDDASVDTVVAATAFHWFDAPRARREFRRILRPGGRTVLIWNRRRKDAPFLEAYDRFLLDRCPDYAARRTSWRENLDSSVASFYGGTGLFRHARFDNLQLLGLDAFIGRVMSSSYAPLPGEPGHEEFAAGMRELFERFESNGRVTMEYDTCVYWGSLAESQDGN